MRFAFLVSGALGFAIVAITGYAADRQPDLVLRDAALGCLLTAIAGRWFWCSLDRAFAETVHARREAAQAAQAAEAAAAASAPVPPATPSKSAPVRPPAVAASTR